MTRILRYTVCVFAGVAVGGTIAFVLLDRSQEQIPAAYRRDAVEANPLWSGLYLSRLSTTTLQLSPFCFHPKSDPTVQHLILPENTPTTFRVAVVMDRQPVVLELVREPQLDAYGNGIGYSGKISGIDGSWVKAILITDDVGPTRGLNGRIGIPGLSRSEEQWQIRMWWMSRSDEIRLGLRPWPGAGSKTLPFTSGGDGREVDRFETEHVVYKASDETGDVFQASHAYDYWDRFPDENGCARPG